MVIVAILAFALIIPLIVWASRQAAVSNNKLSFIHSAFKSFARYPGAAISATTATIISVLCIYNKLGTEYRVEVLIFTLLWGIPLHIALRLLTKDLNLGRLIAPLLGVIAQILLYQYWHELSSAQFILSAGQYSLAVHLLVAFAPFCGKVSANHFWRYNASLLMAFVFSVFYSHLIFILLGVLVGSFLWLNDLNNYGEIFPAIYAVAAVSINTFIFLAFVPDNLSEDDSQLIAPPGLRVLTHYILVPFVLIYLLILYVYLLRLAVFGELPQRVVGWMVCGVSVFGVMTRLLTFPFRNEGSNLVTFYYKYFYKIVLPILGLLFYAVFVRVGEYGLTERRYLLIALGIWLLLVALHGILTGKEHIKLVPISLFCMTIFSAIGPFSAASMAYRSQSERLLNSLQKLGVEVAVSRAAMVPKDENTKAVSDHLNYIVTQYGASSLLPIFGSNEQARQLIDRKLRKQRQRNLFYPEVDDFNKKLLKIYGVPYAFDFYRPEIEERRYFSYSRKLEKVDIRGFSYLLESSPLYDLSEAKKLKGSDFSVSYKSPNLIFDDIHGRHFEVPLANKLKGLQGKSSSYLETQDLVFEAESNGLFIKLLISSVGGWVQNNSVEVDQLEFTLIVKDN